MARDMAFADRILDQHDSSRLAMPRFAVAGFNLHTSGQPYDELADGGRVPVGDLQSGRHPPKPHRGRRFPSRQMDWSYPGKQFHRYERDIYILEMRLSICISIDTKAFHWSSPGFVPPNPPAPSPCPQALPRDYLCSV